MTESQRRAWTTQNPVEKLAQELDQAWQKSSQAAFQSADALVDKAGYYVHNPFDALDQVGDFGHDLAEATWDALRDTAGNGQQWWNEITRVIETPCEDKWWVVVETALPAAGEALWLLLVPSPDEVLENYLSPKGQGHHRRRSRRSDPDSRKDSRSGRKRRSWPGIPDVDGMIASILPGAEAVQGRDAGAGQRWFFGAIDIIDRGLWYYLLLDVTDTFITVWTSGMREARFCSQQWSTIANVTQTGEGTAVTRWGILDPIRNQEGKNVQITDGGENFVMEDPNGNIVPKSGQILARREFWISMDGPESTITWTPIVRIRRSDGSQENIEQPSVTAGHEAWAIVTASLSFADCTHVQLIMNWQIDSVNVYAQKSRGAEYRVFANG